MEGVRKAMNERNRNEGQWEDRKQWSLGVDNVEQRFEADIHTYIHTHTYINTYIHTYIHIYIHRKN